MTLRRPELPDSAFVTRLITRPVQALAGAAADVSSGRYDVARARSPSSRRRCRAARHAEGTTVTYLAAGLRNST